VTPGKKGKSAREKRFSRLSGLVKSKKSEESTFRTNVAARKRSRVEGGKGLWKAHGRTIKREAKKKRKKKAPFKVSVNSRHGNGITLGRHCGAIVRRGEVAGPSFEGAHRKKDSSWGGEENLPMGGRKKERDCFSRRKKKTASRGQKKIART